MQSILDGVTLGATQSAEGDDPAMVEGYHKIEKEVCVTTGQVLRTLMGEHASSEEGQMMWRNHQNFTVL